MSTVKHHLTKHERSYVLTHATRAQQRINVVDWSLTGLTLVPTVLRFLLDGRAQQLVCLIAAVSFALAYISWRLWIFFHRRRAARGALGEMSMRLEIDLDNLLNDADRAITRRRDMTLSFLGNVRFPRRRNPKRTTISFPAELVRTFGLPLAIES